MPARRAENLLAILAALLVAGTLAPWRLRLECAAAAIAVLIVMAMFRYRTLMKTARKQRTIDTYAAIDRIREERDQRYGRRRR